MSSGIILCWRVGASNLLASFGGAPSIWREIASNKIVSDQFQSVEVMPIVRDGYVISQLWTFATAVAQHHLTRSHFMIFGVHDLKVLLLFKLAHIVMRSQSHVHNAVLKIGLAGAYIHKVTSNLYGSCDCMLAN